MSRVASPLVVRLNGRTLRFTGDAPVMVGRDADCDLPVDHPEVSRTHGVFELQGIAWTYRDLGSRNGSYVDGRRVVVEELPGPTRILLGDPADGLVLEVGPDGEQPSDVMQLGRLSGVHEFRGVTVIGRDPAADLRVDDLEVSRRHAELRPAESGFELRDLESYNGTYVNGRRVSRVLLAEGDVVSIGPAVFHYAGGRLVEYADRGAAWMLARSLRMEIDGHVILDDVSFAMEPSSLLAVVGPSGAGKSTLVRALTGFGAATAGTVVYGGRDVYANYASLRNRMGYVPQDDLLHTQLRVRQALEYAAELRFPPDVDRAARRRRVDEVLEELGITARSELQIERLSGGQRKRVSVALELLTRPSLLFFDEPTSGLDPGNEEQVMQLLRDLADGGRLVVVITHSVQSLDVCDRVLFMAPGGVVAFYGPPREALGYFADRGVPDRYAGVFRALSERGDIDWQGEFRRNEAHRRYVAEPLERAGLTAESGEPAAAESRTPSRWRQFRVLTRRYRSVLASDRKTLLLLTLQAPVFGLLFLLLVGTDKLSTNSGTQATMLLWLVIVGATWLGTSNAIREIVKEWPIYQRERAVGLSIVSYVASKVALLAPITIVQTLVLVAIAIVPQHPPPGDPTGLLAMPAHGTVLGSMLAEMAVSVALAGLAGMATGLLVSALVKTSDRALMMLPIILIAQIVASEPLFASSSAAMTPVELVSSAQWGTAGLAATTDLNRIRAVETGAATVGRRYVIRGDATGTRRGAVLLALRDGRSRWDHRPSAWLRNIGVLVGLVIVPLAGAAAALRRRDPRFSGAGASR
jgi:ABC transport system ATP-binding/permease protein